MIYIIIGIAAFLLFAIYDVNSILLKNKLLSCCFFTGCILIVYATVGIIASSRKSIRIDIPRVSFFGISALLFLGLLIYTLFFALPFQKTYLEKNKPKKVCQSGVYALCRHPGVLWFIGFYCTLGLAVRLPLFHKAAAVFCILNILYVIFQDRWTFVHSFEDYDSYKMTTPFLIPNINSVKRCLRIRKSKDRQTG
jgi:protein-S-isoprenylcysteine O-methyltransferase Ste14